MKNIFVVLCLMLFGLNIKAQTLNDPIYLNYSILPNSDFKSEKGGASFQFVELNATLPPVNIGKKVKFLNGLYYRNTNLDFDNSFSQKNTFPSTLHDIRYTAIVRAQISTNWELVLIPRLMIRSDLQQSLNSNDLFAQVVTLANYAIKGNKNFKIGLGIALNNDFERNAIIPIGSLYYESKKFKAEIVYPNANFLYKKSEDFEFGLFVSVDGAISRVSPFTINTERMEYLRSFQLLIAPTISHRVMKNIFGHIKIGVAPIRNFETLTNDFKPSSDQDFSLQSSLFIRAGLSYRIKN